MPDREKIRIVEGIPEFGEIGSESLLNGQIEGPSLSSLEFTEISVVSGLAKDWVKICRQKWDNGEEVYLEYPTQESTGLIKEEKRIVAIRELKDINSLRLWLAVTDETEFIIGPNDDGESYPDYKDEED